MKQKKYSITGVLKILEALDNPQNCYQVIHVAGTNGKGSVSMLLSSILNAAGFEVGLNISPHLSTELERIQLNGENVDRELWNDTYSMIVECSSELNISLSYHEIVTIMAFYIFRNSKVDYAVLEVGLGGRLDASNVIAKAKTCIITSIDYDHCEILGSTLNEILMEKLGILTKGSPLIIGGIKDDLKANVYNYTTCNHSRLYSFRSEFTAQISNNVEPADSIDCQNRSQSTLINYQDDIGELELLTHLRGGYQVNNVAIAVKAARLHGVSDAHIQQGVRDCICPGRLEYLYKSGNVNKMVLLDAAHNIGGIETLERYLEEKGLIFDILLYSSKAEKDWRYGLTSLARFSREIKFYCGPLFVDRQEVEEFSQVKGLNIEFLQGDLSEKLASLCDSQNSILITGSMYLMGPARQILLEENGYTRTSK